MEAIGHSLTLNPPPNPGAFVGTHYDGLNNSMWTIRYEFRCYLLVILLGVAGLLRRPAVLGTMALILIALFPWAPNDPNLAPAWVHLTLWLGIPDQAMILTGMFLAGATFRALQDRLPLTNRHMVLAAAILMGCLFVPYLARLGVATAGAYLIFGIAAKGRATILERINNDNDLSYGLYLYAWPIEKLLIAYGLVSPLWLLALCVWVLAMAMGALSWFLIEKPVLRLVKSRRKDGVRFSFADRRKWSLPRRRAALREGAGMHVDA
jgi:peptidoglycan/LPS O-acetylase OafA/YrhL